MLFVSRDRQQIELFIYIFPVKPFVARAINVNTDYTTDKFNAEVDIELYLTIANILSLGSSTLIRYLKQQMKKGGNLNGKQN